MADECPYIIDRSNLYQVRKQASEYLCDLDLRVDYLEIGGGGERTIYTYIDADYTVTNPREVVLVNSSAGPITVTMLASPLLNHYLRVEDVGDSASWNLITIARNGNTITSKTEDVGIDMSGGWFDFIWTGTTWELGYKLGCDRSNIPADVGAPYWPDMMTYPQTGAGNYALRYAGPTYAMPVSGNQLTYVSQFETSFQPAYSRFLIHTEDGLSGSALDYLVVQLRNDTNKLRITVLDDAGAIVLQIATVAETWTDGVKHGLFFKFDLDLLIYELRIDGQIQPVLEYVAPNTGSGNLYSVPGIGGRVGEDTDGGNNRDFGGRMSYTWFSNQYLNHDYFFTETGQPRIINEVTWVAFNGFQPSMGNDKGQMEINVGVGAAAELNPTITGPAP